MCDSNGGAGEKEGEEDQGGGGWIASGMTWWRGVCQGRTHRPHIKVGKDEEEV